MSHKIAKTTKATEDQMQQLKGRRTLSNTTKRKMMKAIITLAAFVFVAAGVVSAADATNNNHHHGHLHVQQQQEQHADRMNECRRRNQNHCVECVYDEHGYPIPSYYCSIDPCPTKVCCAANEDTCYNENDTAVSCARLGSAGCPCPEIEIRCGNSTFSFGWCDAICCNPEEEESCTDDEGNHFCAKIGECSLTLRAMHKNLRAKK